MLAPYVPDLSAKRQREHRCDCYSRVIWCSTSDGQSRKLAFLECESVGHDIGLMWQGSFQTLTRGLTPEVIHLRTDVFDTVTQGKELLEELFSSEDVSYVK